MDSCAEGARGPEHSGLTEIARILAAGILRLRRRALSNSAHGERSENSSLQRLEVSGETVLSVPTG